MRRIILTIAAIILLISVPQVQAQDTQGTWNYKSYPDLTYNLDHLELSIKLVPDQKLIEGVAAYQITSRRPQLGSLVMHTADLEVESILQTDQELEYAVTGDSLIITLADTLEMGDSAEIQISWQSSSYYGIHKDQLTGTVWTSLNRNAIHHWLPVFDHPRNTTTVDASITAPVSMDVSFNGRRVSDEVVSTDEKMIRFVTETPVPVTGLSLAAGPFVKEEAMSGIKSVSLYTPENVLLDEVRSGLLKIAVTELRNTENALSFEYPFEALNIVVLPDNYWQEKQAGSGVIYLYQNLGSLSAQLKRGLAAQWFGNYHRYPDLNDDLEKAEFLKTVLMGSSSVTLLNPDSLRSVKEWNSWQKGYASLENEFFKTTVANSISDLIRTFSGSLYWQQYATHWYEETGAYWEVLPEPVIQQKADNSDDAAILYRLEGTYDEINSVLELIFTADNGSVDSLGGLNMNIHTFDGVNRESISFTGSDDTLSINLPASVEYVTFSSAETNLSAIELGRFPISFLLSQLRSEDPEIRAQAARQLSYHTDNPDIQLALRDIMRDEQNAEVLAAIYLTLAEVTNGATGTEETFLNALRSDSREIRLAALRSLVNFEENERVKSMVRSTVLRADEDTLFNTALRTYQEIAEVSELMTLAERLQQSDSSGTRALKILDHAMVYDSAGTGLEIADRFTREEYPFNIRKQAFNLLYQHDDASPYWEAKIQVLLNDPDPRVRHLALQATDKISQDQAEEILSNRLNEEFDPRVRQEITAKLSD